MRGARGGRGCGARGAAEEARLREERERAEAAERARLQEEAAAKARENEAAEEAARAVEAKEREMAAKQEEERQLMERLKALQQEKLQIGDEVRAAGKGPKKYSKSELMVLRHEGPTDQLPAALLSPDVPPTHPIHAMKRDAQGGGGGARGGGRGGDRRGGPRDAQWERGGSDRSMGRRGRGPMGDRGPRGFRDDRGGGGFGRTTPPPGLGPDRWGSEAANMPALHKTGNRYVIGQVSGDDPEEEKRQKTFKSLLNKLTPDNFEKLLDKILNVEMPQKVTLVGLVDQIFDKALTETTFSDLYAQLCERAFGSGRLPQWEDEEGKTDFRRVLLNKCQDEFMKGAKAMFDHEHMEHRPKDGKDDKDDKAADEDKGDDEGKTDAEKSAKELELEKRRKELEIEQANLKARRRMFGNIQFIGHLYKRKMLIDKIMHECVRQLLRNPTNPEPEDVEALCKLLSTIGSDFDTKERAQAVDVYFNRMKQMREVEALDSRIKFMLQDVIEMRARGWQMRRAVEGPKKIADIHRAAAMEQRTPRGGPRGFDSRGPPMRGGGPSPRGFDSRGPPPSRNPDWMDRSAPRPLSSFGGGGGGGGGDDYLGPSGGRRTGELARRAAGAPGAGERGGARPGGVASDKDAWASGHGGGDSGAPTPTSPSRGAAGGAMTGAALARKVKSMCDEWHGVRQDVAEANLEIESMTGAGAKGADIVVELIKDGYGATKRNFASLKTLLTGALEAKKLSAADVAAGFSSVLEVIGDDVCDNPYAPKQVGTLAGQLVAEGVLDAAKLAKDMLSAEAPEGEEDPPLLDSGGAVPLVAHMLLAIKESKDEDAAKAAWKSIGKSLLDFHPSFEREDGQAAIDRDVEEFGLAGIV
ncbi:unnamed protein product [Pedinophyceae sp. YPF-701]|nr:unnamed protein product [Pedinophyceae sp. YPF-701]